MKQFDIGNFHVYLLNAGLPVLERLGMAKADYDAKCLKMKKTLEARSFKVQHNGLGNPYDERSQMQQHQSYSSSMQTLPPVFEYFLEDEEDKIKLQLQAYLSAKS